MTYHTLLNITSDFLQTSAEIISDGIAISISPSLKKKTELKQEYKTETLIIVPEKSLISPIKGAITREFAKKNISAEIPKIISIEGLTDDVIETTSRNKIYAKLFELTSQHVSNNDDIAIFTRSALGEIPNLYANYITPNEIISKIPANISTQKEINLNLFVQIWEKLNTWIRQNNVNPYYELHTKILESTLQSCISDNTHIFILHDLGRSPILRNFITKVLKTQVKSTIFLSNTPSFLGIDAKNIGNHTTNEIETNYFHAQANEHEDILVSSVVKHCLNTWKEDSKPQIGIICEDEKLAMDISLHLSKIGISHKHNISDSIQSNPLIRFFLSIIEQKKEKILSMLDISHTEKQNILDLITKGITSEKIAQYPQYIKHELWSKILTLFPKNSLTINQIEAIFSFIESHQQSIITNKNTASVFFQFKYFLLGELRQMGGKEFAQAIILHMANSWKIWEEKPSSNVTVCTLRAAAFNHFDFTIITSSFKVEPQGNLLFSAGLRKYYGFASHDASSQYIKMLKGTIFATGKVPPFPEEFPVQSLVIQLPPKEKQKKYHPITGVKINKNEIPHRLSATQVEKFFTSPLAFYYQYIKNLNQVQYTNQASLEIGNFIHKILENSTRNILADAHFNFTQHIHDEFKQSPFNGMKIFYIEKILQVLREINLNKNIKISVEAIGIETQIDLNERSKITLTAKPDRIDEENNTVTIYDYKTGSSSSFNEKTIENLQKIQLLIPAMSEAYSCEEKRTVGKYIFLEHSTQNDLEFAITQEVIDSFREKVVEYMQKYMINAEELPHGKEMYGYFYCARIS